MLGSAGRPPGPIGAAGLRPQGPAPPPQHSTGIHCQLQQWLVWGGRVGSRRGTATHAPTHPPTHPSPPCPMRTCVSCAAARCCLFASFSLFCAWYTTLSQDTRRATGGSACALTITRSSPRCAASLAPGRQAVRQGKGPLRESGADERSHPAGGNTNGIGAVQAAALSGHTPPGSRGADTLPAACSFRAAARASTPAG